LNTSSKSPVAADDENIFTSVNGTSSPGNPIFPVNCCISPARKSRNPDALNTPTATIRPISVGIIFNTVANPSLAPFTKVSYTSTFFSTPKQTIPKITIGTIKSLTANRSFKKSPFFHLLFLFLKVYVTFPASHS